MYMTRIGSSIGNDEHVVSSEQVQRDSGRMRMIRSSEIVDSF